MDLSTPVRPLLRFGVFELDVRTGELRKSGARVKLQQQPLQVLRILAESSGEVVSRQYLRDQLWPNGIYVDFDRSLNKAVVKLREVLGDSAESPRFIETLPKVGYRFIVPVEASTPSAKSSANVVGVPKVAARPGSYRLASIGLVVGLFLFALFAYFTTPAPPRVISINNLSRSPEPKLAGIVGDGSRIYFSQHDDDLVHPMQLSVSGGEAIPLSSSLKNCVIYDISPDRSELLVGTVAAGSVQYDWPPPLWILPLVGGAPQRVGEVRAQSATWYPDAKSILYANRGELYRIDRDGGNARKLLSVSGEIKNPRWSPDGLTLRFDIDSRGDTVSIWEARRDGANLHLLFPGWNSPASECCGRWTPDGRFYVFQSRSAGRTDLWAIREKWPPWRKRDRSPVRLTSGPLNFLTPFPSADGRKIYAIGEQELGELVRLDATSKQFVPFLNGISAEGVSFSADGQWVTYVSYPEGILWRSRIDGTERLQLTQPPLLACLPGWSPDGRQIVFAGSGEGESLWQIYVVSVDGGRPKRLTSSTSNSLLPFWSPDGTRVAYSGFPVSSPEISVVNVSTLQVTSVPGSKGFCSPTWLRDGRIVALATQPARMVLFDPGSQTWSQVWQGPFDYYDVSHDGKYIYFDTKWESDPAIFRLRIADRKLEKIASLAGVRRTVGMAGTWFALSATDAPMLLRNLNTEQVYQLNLQLP